MIKKKLLLLGATGMAGHMAYYYLKNTNKYNIVNVVYRTPLTEDSIVVDVTDTGAVSEILYTEKPDVVVNCIGVLIKGANEHPDQAIFVNAYFPHLLKKITDIIGAKLVHISTDCVFSGKRGKYTEIDFRDADDVYGRSKALGEIINAKDITIRTSIIGPELKKEGEGLFCWFMQQKGEVNGFTAAQWGGVTTLELAKAIDAVIEQDVVGLIHLSNDKSISKYDLLNLIKTVWNKQDVVIKPYGGYKMDKSIARSDRFHYIVPSYRTMLDHLYQWMQKHSELYDLSKSERL